MASIASDSERHTTGLGKLRERKMKQAADTIKSSSSPNDKVAGNASSGEKEQIQLLCSRIVEEQDPQKFLELVEKLNTLLEKNAGSLSPTTRRA